MVLNNGLGVSLVVGMGERIEIWQKGSEGNLSSAWDHFCLDVPTGARISFMHSIHTYSTESKTQVNSINHYPEYLICLDFGDFNT